MIGLAYNAGQLMMLALVEVYLNIAEPASKLLCFQMGVQLLAGQQRTAHELQQARERTGGSLTAETQEAGKNWPGRTIACYVPCVVVDVVVWILHLPSMAVACNGSCLPHSQVSM